MEYLQAILLALLGPAGIWFGWHLQKRDKNDERAQLRREMLRQKAEEIFEETLAAQDRSLAAVHLALQDRYGLLDQGIVVGKAGEIDRLKALLQMYFPKSAPILAEHDERVYPLIKQYSSVFEEISDLPTDEGLKRVRESRLETSRKEHEITTVTLVKVRFFMFEEVKALV